MGCVEQAVLAFDEEVQVPWRPRLVSAPAVAVLRPVPAVRRPVRHSPSKVGACRPRARPPARALRGTGLTGPPGGRGVSLRPRPRLRLTRRARRLVAVLALFGAVVLGSLLGSVVSGGGGRALDLAGVSSVVVQPGDTLWSLAESVAGENDVRAVIDRIQELNELEGSDLAPGQVLRLP